MNVTSRTIRPDVAKAEADGIPHGGRMSHDRRHGTVTWTMSAADAYELGEALQIWAPDIDLAQEDAAALRHHGLRGQAR